MSEHSWHQRPAGLLVPANLDDPPTPTSVIACDMAEVAEVSESDRLDPVVVLEAKLHTSRRAAMVHTTHDIALRRDKLLRRAELSLIDDDEAEWAAELKRRAADRAARIEMETLRRQTAAGGHRARIRTMVVRSAEHRAVRIDTVRKASLHVGGAALLVMALWSTAGVHAGVVALLGLPTHTLGWWAAWIVEPALMGIVALIIISRSMLRSAGGQLGTAAGWVEAGALTTSILLNLAGGSVDAEGWILICMMAAHSIGPVGAAAVAYLIGVIDASCAAADPWTGAPTMADLGLIEPVEAESTPRSGGTNVRLMPCEQGKQSTPRSGGENALRIAPDQGKQQHTPIRLQLLNTIDSKVYEETANAIDRGELATPPSAHAIYRQIMQQKGDRTIATRVAKALTT